jgi:hypothetical protein
MTWPKIIGKTNDEMNITDKCTCSGNWLSSNNKFHITNLVSIGPV